VSLRTILRRSASAVAIAVGFTLIYEVVTLDSQSAARQTALREAIDAPFPGARLTFTATAYCKGSTTASGVAAQRGVAAADPELLPVGSVIEIDAPEPQYDGIYTVMDTGPNVQGRRVDLYMWSCNEALQFGRKAVRLTVLRLGWNPRHSTSPSTDHPADRPSPFSTW
jgi:3D (Asp-Asp-Asp) domain-containing protein